MSVTLIKPIHSGGCAVGDDALNGFGNRGDRWGNCLFLLGGEVSEHVPDYGILVGGGRAILSGRPTDAHLDPGEVLTSQSRYYRFQPLVSCRTATFAYTYLAQRQVEVIEDDQQVIHSDVVFPHQ